MKFNFAMLSWRLQPMPSWPRLSCPANESGYAK
jgi:hypothetical protein